MTTDSNTLDRSSELYLEDPVVGQEFSSGEYPLAAEEITTFASKYDPQPFHTDPEAAKRTFFKGHAASGWHTMAITMRLIVESVPFARGILGINAMVAWPRPTRPRDVLRTTSTIDAITPSASKPDRGVVLLHTQTLNQAGEVVLDVSAKILVFKKDGA